MTSQPPAPGVSDACSIHDTCKHSVVRTPLHILQMTWTSEAGRYLHWTKQLVSQQSARTRAPACPRRRTAANSQLRAGFAFGKSAAPNIEIQKGHSSWNSSLSETLCPAKRWCLLFVGGVFRSDIDQTARWWARQNTNRAASWVMREGRAFLNLNHQGSSHSEWKRRTLCTFSEVFSNVLFLLATVKSLTTSAS